MVSGRETMGTRSILGKSDGLSLFGQWSSPPLTSTRATPGSPACPTGSESADFGAHDSLAWRRNHQPRIDLVSRAVLGLQHHLPEFLVGDGRPLVSHEFPLVIHLDSPLPNVPDSHHRDANIIEMRPEIRRGAFVGSPNGEPTVGYGGQFIGKLGLCGAHLDLPPFG